MENARVIIIEDEKQIRDGYRRNLEAGQHSVVAEAGSLVAAYAMVDGLQPDEVDVAVVDGNLSSESEGGFDGQDVTNYIHENLEGVIVIGSSFDGRVRGADFNVQKSDPWALHNKIAEL